MKIVFYHKFLYTILIIIIVLLLVNLSYLVWGNLRFRNAYSHDVVSEINKYEVRSELLMDAMNMVGNHTPQSTAKVWAEGLKMRSAAMQYAAMASELKEEYAGQLEKNAPNWITGMSSPWISNYKILNVKKLDTNSNIVEIMFYTLTSTGPAGDYKAILTIKKEGEFYRIVKIWADKELYPYTRFK